MTRTRRLSRSSAHSTRARSSSKFLLLAEAAAEVVEAVRQEIDYYLVKLGERDPWAYAIYHTTTLSNALGDVHWGYVDGGEERHAAVRVEVVLDDATLRRRQVSRCGVQGRSSAGRTRAIASGSGRSERWER